MRNDNSKRRYKKWGVGSILLFLAVLGMQVHASRTMVPINGQLIPETKNQESETPSKPKESETSSKPKESETPSPKPEESNITPPKLEESETPSSIVPKEEEQEFLKMPLNERVKPGGEVVYQVSGFGNDTLEDMERYSITDMLPQGLALESLSIPNFTNGEHLFYNIEYETNKKDRTVLQSHQQAHQKNYVKVPAMEDGEYMIYISIVFDRVNPGFGMNNSLLFNCRLSKNPPSHTIVNEAVLSYVQNNKMFKKSSKARQLKILSAVQTGDNTDVLLYSFTILIASVSLALVLIEKKKKVRK